MDDVLVGDLAGEEQFVLEALFRLRRNRAIRRILPDDFQRNGDTQLGIPRLIHGTHAAGAKQLDDVIPRSEGLAHMQRTLARWNCHRQGRIAGRDIGVGDAGGAGRAGGKARGVERQDARDGVCVATAATRAADAGRIRRRATGGAIHKLAGRQHYPALSPVTQSTDVTYRPRG